MFHLCFIGGFFLLPVGLRPSAALCLSAKSAAHLPLKFPRMFNRPLHPARQLRSACCHYTGPLGAHRWKSPSAVINTAVRHAEHPQRRAELQPTPPIAIWPLEAVLLLPANH